MTWIIVANVAVFVFFLFLVRWANKQPGQERAVSSSGMLQVGGELLFVEYIELTDRSVRIHADGIARQAYGKGEVIGSVKILGDDGLIVAAYPDEIAPDDIAVGDGLNMRYDLDLLGREKDEFERWVLAP